MNLARFPRRGYADGPTPLQPLARRSKTMTGLIDLVRKGFFKKGENLLFVHTGGSPALDAYLDGFWE